MLMPCLFQAQLESRHLRYATLDVDVARFSRALANHLNEYMRPYESITADSIRVTSAATAMHDILAWGLADPGDAFLVSRPIYGRFEIDFGNKSQVKLVYADTNAETCFNVDVVEQFEKALVRSDYAAVKIRALLIVNPHNPLGTYFHGHLKALLT